MNAAAALKAATPAQIAAWKKRTGHSDRTAAELFGVHPRTFSRWLAGDTASPKLLGDRFREGVR